MNPAATNATGSPAGGRRRAILVDLCHPAHVHFFRHPIALWRGAGHQVHIAGREKDVALPLLRELGLECTPLGRAGKGAAALLRELMTRDVALYRLARRVGADVITGIGGIFAAHAAWAGRIPSVVFYDTEMATLQNALTYPLATRVVVPRCYGGWTPRARTLRYDGYHELSYLHPNRFQPDRTRALAAGLDPERPTFLVRLVAWTANHDFGDSGLSPAAVRDLIGRMQARGRVIISSEAGLPADLAELRFRGNVADMHHLMAFCSGYFGESATMASECAVLGVPAVYAANEARGYTDEQESRYQLVRNVRELGHDALLAGLDWLLRQPVPPLESQRHKLLSETIDVAAFVADTVVAVAQHGRR